MFSFNKFHRWINRPPTKSEDIPPDSILNHLSEPLTKMLETRGHLSVPKYTTKVFREPDDEVLTQAIDTVCKFIDDGKQILVFGDYDVDGMTATAVMLTALQYIIKDKAIWTIPDRLTEDYGLSVKGVTDKLPTSCLVITVDNGISCHDEVATLKEQGYTVVVTDHHLKDDNKLVPDCIVFDPKIIYPEDHDEYMAPGVYVATRVAYSVLMRYRDKLTEEQVDTFRKYASMLIGIGIISDVIELNYTMRDLLYTAITYMNVTTMPCVSELLKASGKNIGQPICSTFLAFNVIPKLNAAGRMGRPGLGVELLTAKNKNDAMLICIELDNLNKERKVIERCIYDDAKRLMDDSDTKHCNVVFRHDWHPGVLGIIASRIMDETGKPTIVLTLDKDGKTVKGSGRAPTGFDLHDTLGKCTTITSFGGHQVAAGVELELHRLADFTSEFDRLCDLNIDHIDIHVDAEIKVTDTYDVITQQAWQLVEPTGPNNPPLQFQISDLHVDDLIIRGDLIKIFASDKYRNRIKLSRFRPPDEFATLKDTIIDVVVTPTFIYFRGVCQLDLKVVSIHFKGRNYI